MEEDFVQLIDKLERLTSGGPFVLSGPSIAKKESEIKSQFSLTEPEVRMLALLLQRTRVDLTLPEVSLLLSLPLHLLESSVFGDETFASYVTQINGPAIRKLLVELYLNK